MNHVLPKGVLAAHLFDQFSVHFFLSPSCHKSFFPRSHLSSLTSAHERVLLEAHPKLLSPCNARYLSHTSWSQEVSSLVALSVDFMLRAFGTIPQLRCKKPKPLFHNIKTHFVHLASTYIFPSSPSSTPLSFSTCVASYSAPFLKLSFLCVCQQRELAQEKSSRNCSNVTRDHQISRTISQFTGNVPAHTRRMPSGPIKDRPKKLLVP